MWSFSFSIPLYIHLGQLGNRPRICQYNDNDLVMFSPFNVSLEACVMYPFNGLYSRHPFSGALLDSSSLPRHGQGSFSRSRPLPAGGASPARRRLGLTRSLIRTWGFLCTDYGPLRGGWKRSWIVCWRVPIEIRPTAGWPNICNTSGLTSLPISIVLVWMPPTMWPSAPSEL